MMKMGVLIESLINVILPLHITCTQTANLLEFVYHMS